MYIDESGDLGEKEGSSRNIIISALLIDNPSSLDRIIKNMRRNKFKRDLRVFPELKANKLKHDIIIYALKQLNAVKDAQVFHMILEKKKLRSNFLKNDKNKCYNFIAGKLARNILLQGVDMDIKIDKSKGKQMLQEDFNQYFKRRLREKSTLLKVTIQHSYSHSWAGLQFADLLAWSAFQKVEHNHPAFIDILEMQQEAYNVW
jgi:hypothetical protein